MITLLNQTQIKDYFSPSGNFHSTGLTYLDGLNVSGNFSGVSGNFSNLVCQTLDATVIRCDFLSGILGTTTTGSGIFTFLAVPDVSGLNTHYRAVFSTGNVSNPIQAFSSQDSQSEWQYYNNNTAPSWVAFPAIGLNSTEQQSSFVRLMFKPTGFNISQTYFVHAQNIFAGNVSGTYTISEQFKANANGFTLVTLPSLQSLYETADSRYVRKQQVGTDFIVSGVKWSGSPIAIPTFPTVPSTNHGTGTLVSVSGRLFVFDSVVGFTGYRPASIVTGYGVTTGNGLSAEFLKISGDGQIQTRILGNDTIVISGGGVNQFAIATQILKQGNLILSGGSNITLSSGNSTSGTIVTINSSASSSSVGGVTGFAANSSSPLFTGAFYISGSGGTTVSFVNGGANTSGFVISSSSAGGAGQVTGFSTSLNSPLFTGGFVVTGQQNITASLTNLGNNISGILILNSNPFLMSEDELMLNIFNTIGY